MLHADVKSAPPASSGALDGIVFCGTDGGSNAQFNVMEAVVGSYCCCACSLGKTGECKETKNARWLSRRLGVCASVVVRICHISFEMA